MRILPEYIQTKELAGRTSDGRPILYVLTKGGLHAFFTREQTNTITLGAAPHKGIAAWMAERRSPGIQWQPSENIAKSEEDRFQALRSVIFGPRAAAGAIDSDLFVVYNWRDRYMDLMSKAEVSEALGKGERPDSLVRRLDMTDQAIRLSDWESK